MQTFTTVPFKSEATHGLTSVNGVAKFSSAGVVLEFEAKLFGLISNGIKETRLSVNDILDLKFKKGILKRGAKIEIRTKTLAAMAELPSDDGKLVLKIKPEDFERAHDAVDKLQKDMATDLAQLPPTHTPVSVLFDAGEDETRDLKE